MYWNVKEFSMIWVYDSNSEYIYGSNSIVHLMQMPAKPNK